MPILQTERTFKRIVLPSSTKDDPAWVEVWEKLLTTDVVAISGAGTNQSEAAMRVITNIIKAWNFTDKAGVVLPVNFENVQHLSIQDFAKIIEETSAFKEMEALTTQKKNNSLTTLVPKPTLKTAKKPHSRNHP
jgi:hypothetical protein